MFVLIHVDNPEYVYMDILYFHSGVFYPLACGRVHYVQLQDDQNITKN